MIDILFKYETPSWGAKLICALYALLALPSFIAFYTYDQWAGDAPTILSYLILLVGIVFILSALKPSNWKGWIYFMADEKGLYFPHEEQQPAEDTSLFVPWEHVGTIRTERLYGGKSGLSIEIDTNFDDLEHHFSRQRLVNKLLGFNQERNGYYVVAYANNGFQGLDQVVDTLCRLKNS